MSYECLIPAVTLVINENHIIAELIMVKIAICFDLSHVMLCIYSS